MAGSRSRLYTYFFGVRGLLRLYPVVVTAVFSGFVLSAMMILTGRGLSHLTDSLTLSLYYWKHVLVMALYFAFMVWFLAIHRRSIFRRDASTSDELRDYDWWGRCVHAEVA